MSLSASLLFMLTGNAPHPNATDRGSDVLQSPSPEQDDLRRCKTYRKSFPMAEIALPATTLRNRAIAKWVKDHRLTVDVRTSEELAAAIAAGVDLPRLTVYADALRESDLHAAVDLGVGRVVAWSVQQIDLLKSVVAERTQDVVIRTTALDTPVWAIADAGRRVPCGFRFGGGRAVPSGDWAIELPELRAQIDESLDDACGTPRFPRPLVVLSTGLGIIGRSAA